MDALEQQSLDSQDSVCGSYYEQVMQVPLAPIGVGRMVIGAICEVNGEGAVEHITQVTTLEIELLCKHWAERVLDIDRGWQVYGTSGSREIRELPYAQIRLGHFAEILGEEKVEAIVAEVYKDFEPEKEREAYEAWLAQEPDPPGDQPPAEDSAEGSLPS